VGRQSFAGIVALIAAVLSMACTTSRAKDAVPVTAVQAVKVVVDRRYLQECEFLKWFPYRDSVGTVGGEGTGASTNEVVKAGGNVMFLPGDPANIGRFAAYRCGEEQLKKLPRIMTSQ
jgi:hypothetical protein